MSSDNPLDISQMNNIMQALGPPPANSAEIDYMNALWTSINQFSGAMMNANEKYRKAISRKRKSPPPPSNTNTNTTIQPPERKKRKTSPKKSTTKSPKKPTTKTPKKKPPKNPTSKSPKKNKTKKPGGKSNIDRIYKIRRPRTSWMLFNAFQTAELVADHPTSTLGERTQMSSKLWHALNTSERKKWDDLASAEKKEYLSIVDDFKTHTDFNQIPTKWKQIDKKAEQERKKEKMDIDDEIKKDKQSCNICLIKRKATYLPEFCIIQNQIQSQKSQEILLLGSSSLIDKSLG
eukprot:316301_1